MAPKIESPKCSNLWKPLTTLNTPSSSLIVSAFDNPHKSAICDGFLTFGNGGILLQAGNGTTKRVLSYVTRGSRSSSAAVIIVLGAVGVLAGRR